MTPLTPEQSDEVARARHAGTQRELEDLIARMVADAEARALREAAEALIPFPSNDYGAFPWGAQQWLRDRADRIGGKP